MSLAGWQAMIVRIDPEMPGITPKKVRNGRGYRTAKGHRIAGRDEVDRPNRIAVPRAKRWLKPAERALIALLDEGTEDLSKAA